MNTGVRAIAGGDKRRGRGTTRVGVIVTLVVHGIVVAAVGIAHSSLMASPHRHLSFVSAELVKLGQRPDDARLPQLTEPHLVAPPAKRSRVTENPNARPAAPEAQPPEAPGRSRSPSPRPPWLNPVIDVTPGDPDQSAFGTSDRNAGDRYLADITGRLRENYFRAAGMASEQIPTPPQIQFRLTDDGTISDVTLTKSSGSPLVDDACLNAARLTPQVPIPPANFSQRILGVSCER